jgi:hypothetical protein
MPVMYSHARLSEKALEAGDSYRSNISRPNHTAAPLPPGQQPRRGQDYRESAQWRGVICAEPFRVSWRDEVADVTGYRVELGDANMGELFSYAVPPGVGTFVFPAEAASQQPASGLDCRRSKDYTLDVLALGPAGERLVGGLHRTGECDLHTVPSPADPPCAGTGR